MTNATPLRQPPVPAATPSRSVTFSGNRTISVPNSAVSLTLGGAIGESGDRTLTKTGNGTVTLSGANSYTGTTTVSAGILNAANNTALGTTAAGTTVASGDARYLRQRVDRRRGADRQRHRDRPGPA